MSCGFGNVKRTLGLVIDLLHATRNNFGSGANSMVIPVQHCLNDTEMPFHRLEAGLYSVELIKTVSASEGDAFIMVGFDRRRRCITGKFGSHSLPSYLHQSLPFAERNGIRSSARR